MWKQEYLKPGEFETEPDDKKVTVQNDRTQGKELAREIGIAHIKNAANRIVRDHRYIS